MKPTSYITNEFGSSTLHTSSAQYSLYLSGGRGMADQYELVELSCCLHTKFSHRHRSHLDTVLGVMRVWIRKYVRKSRVQKRETQYVFIVKRCRESFKGLPNKRIRNDIAKGNLVFLMCFSKCLGVVNTELYADVFTIYIHNNMYMIIDLFEYWRVVYLYFFILLFIGVK